MNKGNWRERLKLFAKAWAFIMVIVVTATLSISTTVMAAPEDEGLTNGLTQRTPTMTEPNGFSIIYNNNEGQLSSNIRIFQKTWSMPLSLWKTTISGSTMDLTSSE